MLAKKRPIYDSVNTIIERKLVGRIKLFPTPCTHLIVNVWLTSNSFDNNFIKSYSDACFKQKSDIHKYIFINTAIHNHSKIMSKSNPCRLFVYPNFANKKTPSAISSHIYHLHTSRHIRASARWINSGGGEAQWGARVRGAARDNRYKIL